MTVSISNTIINITLSVDEMNILKALSGRVGLTTSVENYISDVLARNKHAIAGLERDILQNDATVTAIPKDEVALIASYLARPEFAVMLTNTKP